MILVSLSLTLITSLGAVFGQFLVERGTPVVSVRDGLWSDPATWGGQLPDEGDAVDIGAGTNVVIDVSPPVLGSVYVRGALGFDESVPEIELQSHWIAVEAGGVLAAGSESDPYESRIVLTLHGTDETENIRGSGIMMHGTKCLIGMPGSLVQFHGASREKVSWTQIDAHANPGDTSIVLKEPTGWEPGDKIGIAPSGWNPAEAESVTLTEVNGTTVHFAEPLRYRHWGTVQEIPGDQEGEIFEVDQRAEVGLLSRNIVIQGAEDSYEAPPEPWTYDGNEYFYPRGFGAHTMFMPNSFVRMEGVEFFRCGQTGHKARYPFHWHLARDVTGQYIRSCSVRDSFQRAYVVHGTDNALVENNVAYNVTNHAFITEDGTEEGNRFLGNLCILTWTPKQEDFAFFNPSRAHGKTDQSEIRCAAFWMVNGNNEVRGNCAAGAFRGIGFFWDHQTVGAGKDTPIFRFEDNVAHSCFRPRFGGRDHYGPMEVGFGLMFRWATTGFHDVFVDRFFAYKCSNGGAWIEEEKVMRNCLFADNTFAVHMGVSTIEDSVIIGDTANSVDGEWPKYGGILVAPGAYARDELDTLIDGVTFVDVERGAFSLRNGPLLPRASLRNLRYIRCHPVRFKDDDSTVLSIHYRDLDGTTTGMGPGSLVLFDNGLSGHPGSVTDPVTGVQFSEDIGQLWLRAVSGGGEIRNGTTNPVVRGDGSMGRFVRGGQTDRSTSQGWVVPYEIYDIQTNLVSPVSLEADYAYGDQWAIAALPFEVAGMKGVFEASPSFRGTVRPDLLRPLTSHGSLADLQVSGRDGFFASETEGKVYVRISNGKKVVLCDEGLTDGGTLYRWFQERFGNEAVLDPAGIETWGAYADPDGDLVPNIWEMVFGSDPLVAEPGRVPTADFRVADGEIAMRFAYDAEAAGFEDTHSELDIEYSFDGIHWSGGGESRSTLETVGSVTFFESKLKRLSLGDAPVIFARLTLGINTSGLRVGERGSDTETIHFTLASDDPEALSYRSWAGRFGLSGEGADPMGDGDGDGAVLLSEFAFGGDPSEAFPLPLEPIAEPTGFGGYQIGIRYPAGAPGVRYRLQVSTDMITWEDAEDEPGFRSESISWEGGRRVIEATVTQGIHERCFVRMAVDMGIDE